MIKEATARRHAEPSGLLAQDVGKRIREARHARGLSLAALGGDDLSRSFLSAVESGRSRISLRALQIVATRLDKPMSYFLDQTAVASDAAVALLLDRAETAIRAQQPAEATRLLQNLDVPDSLRWRALWLQGWTSLALGHAHEAIPLLEDALPLVETGGDTRQLVQVLYTLATAFYNHDIYDEARRYYVRALDGTIEHLHDDDLQARITVCLGHLYYVKGELDHAIDHYERARQLFEAVDNFDNLASIYSGLSRIWEQRHDFANALRYSRMSLGIHELKHNRREAAHELNNMAACWRDLGELDKALTDSSNAIVRAREAGAPDVEAVAHSTRSAIYLEQGELDDAKAEAQEADRLAASDADLARINAWVVRAKVAEREQDRATSDRYFQRAITALEASSHAAEHASTALEYSLLLEERGDTRDALKYALVAAKARTR